MNERDLLLKAVCENPDDDTPRLVFADWLDERGEAERAEFIRLQIQLARGTYRPSEEARLKRRERKLRAHIDRWKAGELPEAEHVSFTRGFIESAVFANEEPIWYSRPVVWAGVIIVSRSGLPLRMRVSPSRSVAPRASSNSLALSTLKVRSNWLITSSGAHGFQPS